MRVDDQDETGQALELTGKMLVAMPGMGDLRFDRSLVFLCAHSEGGAMGLIVNKPAQDLVLGEVLEQLDIIVTPDVRAMPVYFGGPVQTSRGFVLHSDDYTSSLQGLKVEGGFGMTATQDILEDIGRGAGPERALMMLGYAGWGPGQLEQEILGNGWLTCDADRDLVFGPDEDKWQRALKSLGVDPLTLSGTAGHA